MTTDPKDKTASPEPTTLDDDDIVSTRAVSRRSFLAKTGIAAGVATTGAAALASERAAASDPIGEGSDTDPYDPYGGGTDADPGDPIGEGTDYD